MQNQLNRETSKYFSVMGKIAGVRGSRTHPSGLYQDTRGFEDRGGHRTPSTPRYLRPNLWGNS